MQIILKDGYITILNNTGNVGSKIQADVVIKYVDGFEHSKFFYSINNEKYLPIEKEQITFTQEHLSKPYIDLKIKAETKAGTALFKSDRIPLTHAIVFGENIEDAYPEKIKAIEKEIQHLRKTSMKILDYIEEVEKRGRLL